MARDKNAALMVPLGLLAAGGFAFISMRKAQASDVVPGEPPRPPMPDKPGASTDPGATVPALPGAGTDKPPPMPGPSTPRATLGRPYQPGNAKLNAATACKSTVVAHPNGYRQGSSQARADWLTNVAYWETTVNQPAAPLRITDEKRHKQWAALWLQIRAMVRACLSAGAKPPKVPGADKPAPSQSFPDRGAEIRNAALAVDQNPQTYPRLSTPYNKRGAGQANDAWLTNVAYWETYPNGPVKLSGSKGDAKYVTAWKRINGLVQVGIYKKEKKNAKPPPPTVPGPSASPDASPPETTPSTVPPPAALTTDKASLAGAAEARNAAIVAVDQPTKYSRKPAPFNVWKGANAKQTLGDWLTNVAYWETYPNAPTKLSGSAGDKPYVAAWLRLREHVLRGLALAKKLPAEAPGGGVRGRDWKVWAVVMANSSSLRTATTIGAGWIQARKYFATPQGGAVVSRDRGAKAGPLTVTLSGLLAEAARRGSLGKLDTMPTWRTSPGRPFWAATTLF